MEFSFVFRGGHVPLVGPRSLPCGRGLRKMHGGNSVISPVKWTSFFAFFLCGLARRFGSCGDTESQRLSSFCVLPAGLQFLGPTFCPNWALVVQQPIDLTFTFVLFLFFFPLPF